MLRLITLLCLAVSGCLATAIQFNSLPTNTQFGTYNGFVPSTVDDRPNRLLICDDFDHTTYVPSGKIMFSASVLTGADPLQYARFVDPGHSEASLAMYEEAAFLLDGLSRSGPGSALDLTAYYQYALWHLFTPSAALPRGSTAQTLLNYAAASVNNGNLSNALLYSRLRIYTPQAAYASNQEFLELLSAPGDSPWSASDSPAPESSPAVLIGIGIGLAALSYVLRRLLRRRADHRPGSGGAVTDARRDSLPARS